MKEKILMVLFDRRQGLDRLSSSYLYKTIPEHVSMLEKFLDHRKYSKARGDGCGWTITHPFFCFDICPFGIVHNLRLQLLTYFDHPPTYVYILFYKLLQIF